MPSKKLNAAFLKAVKPSGPLTDYTDTEAPGLTLRVHGSGHKTWCVRYRSPIDGKQKRLGIKGRYPDVTLEEARGKAHAVAVAIAAGKDPEPETTPGAEGDGANDGTVRALLAGYVAYLKDQQRGSWDQTERYFIADVLPVWGDRPARSITRPEVRALVTKKAATAKVAANRLLTHISAAFTWAVRNDLLDANVAAAMDDPGGKEVPRDRVLTPDELRAVWTAIDAVCADRPELGALTKLRLVTAQRGGELAALKWSDLDDDVLVIPAAIAKNRREHRVPLTATAQALIKTVPRMSGCDFIFFSRRKTNGHLTDEKKLAPELLAYLTKQGTPIAEFTGHDLRRTAATLMAKGKDGVPRWLVDEIQNHVDGTESAVSRTYNLHTYDERKREGLETWERKLLAILTPKQRAALAA